MAIDERTWRLDKGWRAREVRTWREEDKTTTQMTGGSLGLYIAQRFLHADEQAEAILKIYEGRLSLDYLDWNGRC